MELDPDKFEDNFNPLENPASDEEIYEIFEEAGWSMADPEENAKFEAWKVCKRMRLPLQNILRCWPNLYSQVPATGP